MPSPARSRPRAKPPARAPRAPRSPRPHERPSPPDEPSRPRRPRLYVGLDRADLSEARLVDVLFHGLHAGEDDTTEGVLGDVRAELDVLVTLAIASDRMEVREIGTSLAGVSRRLDVALELHRRGVRTRWINPPIEGDTPKT